MVKRLSIVLLVVGFIISFGVPEITGVEPILGAALRLPFGFCEEKQ
jgi:hypothetical protein